MKSWEPFRGSILGGFNGCAAVVTPADLVALGGGTKLALLALGRGFEGAAAAHFFENAFGVQLGLQTLESTIDGLAFFEINSSHVYIGVVPVVNGAG